LRDGESLLLEELLSNAKTSSWQSEKLVQSCDSG
jgi:hypothetical protein